MASYYEPVIQHTDPDISTYDHRSIYRPSVPGRVADNAGFERKVAAPDNSSGHSPSSLDVYDSFHATTSEASMSQRRPPSTLRGLDGDGTELQPLRSRVESIESARLKALSGTSLPVSYELQDQDPNLKGSNRQPIIKRGWQNVSSSYQKRLRHSRLYGWRMGVMFGSLASALVLMCNIALLCVGQRRSGYDKDGIATLFEGDEDEVSRFNIGAHVLINALSTVLLSASNYTMQVLNSPTRHDIDKAHVKGKWFDIGLLSLRNMRRIPRKRAILCLLLALSSTPLHLFYNASVFRIVRGSSYQVHIIQRDSAAWKEHTENNGNFTRLGVSEYKRIYDGEYVSRYGDLYLAVDSIAFDASDSGHGGNLSLSRWLPYTIKSAAFANHTRFVRPSVEGWASIAWLPIPQSSNSPTEIQMKEGYTFNTGRNSRVQIHLYFMIVVVVCNLFKLAVMIYTLMDHHSEPLVTLGDAAASFLQRPEVLTEGKCMLSTEELIACYDQSWTSEYSTTGEENDAWRPKVRKYCSSIGFDKAWAATIS
ncbi:hypothetical protein IQ06DRAFT_23618 [Phaeosphaeriaceae sp. SRC1lsM3a]|nr:hypothetical protein IQ06DRAFT_23618 [Stagonospora sp. SRC1lsM3a]